MKLNYLKFGTTAFVWLLGTALVSGQQLADQSGIDLKDLSAFKNPGQTWSVAGGVTANLNEVNVLNVIKGTGVLVNQPTKKIAGSDIFTLGEHGDIVLELDYLMAKGANSGIYLQGNYEIQLEDSWGMLSPTAANNGAIYARWDDARGEGKQGYEGHAPRQNASKAPGLWQHIKIAFQAAKFDGSMKKTANARIIAIELNGVLIHDNIELFGSTRGSAGFEKPLGPLRLQGDHGAVAFRNIKFSKLPADAVNRQRENGTNPIYIDPATTPNIRSFVDIQGGPKVVHAISVSSPTQVNYSYDLDNGYLFQAWHGEFVDATPMWDGRGNGTSRPRGSVTTFTKKPVPALAKLADAKAAWVADTTGTGFRTKGYMVDADDRPTFTYNMYGTKVTDAIKVLNNGQGLNREITLTTPVDNVYALVVSGASDIQDLSKGVYLVDGQSYYVKFDDIKDKPVIRDVDGKKDLVVLVRGKLNYSILF
ncbi:3-keto-disaccharide hydrolase [Pedobacter sp. PWIIR3]